MEDSQTQIRNKISFFHWPKSASTWSIYFMASSPISKRMLVLRALCQNDCKSQLICQTIDILWDKNGPTSKNALTFLLFEVPGHHVNTLSSYWPGCHVNSLFYWLSVTKRALLNKHQNTKHLCNHLIWLHLSLVTLQIYWFALSKPNCLWWLGKFAVPIRCTYFIFFKYFRYLRVFSSSIMYFLVQTNL